MTARILVGDCREVMATLPEASVQCVVTSPPYFGIRDYGTAGQIGLEATVEEYVAQMVAVFDGVRRVLRDDGTVWLNMGDCYSSGNSGQRVRDNNGGFQPGLSTRTQDATAANPGRKPIAGMKTKDLIGIPWRVAFALQANGWYLRSDIIWHKPNPMPESVTDRPTKAHEYVFLLTKSARYYYDAAAVAEPVTRSSGGWQSRQRKVLLSAGSSTLTTTNRNDGGVCTGSGVTGVGRNRRSVWTIATRPYAEAHFATFPPALVEPCIKAGSKAGDVVLDPFAGAGTTLLVAERLGRDSIGIELNPTYAEMTAARVKDDAPLLSRVEVCA